MPIMRMRRSSKAAFVLLAWGAAMDHVGALPPAPTMQSAKQAAAEAPAVPAAPSDTLLDALTCRASVADIPGLLPRLRRERPSEFVQTERQYSVPMMDLYRLADTVQAWGQHSDAVVITANRVLLLVDAPLEHATARLEQALEQSRDAPLSGALDDQHALVVYAGEQPGLQGRTLIGCEYRIEGLSLLDDPADAWRKTSP